MSLLSTHKLMSTRGGHVLTIPRTTCIYISLHTTLRCPKINKLSSKLQAKVSIFLCLFLLLCTFLLSWSDSDQPLFVFCNEIAIWISNSLLCTSVLNLDIPKCHLLLFLYLSIDLIRSSVSLVLDSFECAWISFLTVRFVCMLSALSWLVYDARICTSTQSCEQRIKLYVFFL